MKLHLVIIHLSLRLGFTDGGVEYLTENGVSIQNHYALSELSQYFSGRRIELLKTNKINKNYQLLIKERLKSLIQKKSEIQLVRHVNGSIQVKVPKSKLLDILSVKQKYSQDSTGVSNDPPGKEKHEQTMLEPQEDNGSDTLDKLIKMLTNLKVLGDPKVSKADDEHTNTLDEMLRILETINTSLKSADKAKVKQRKHVKAKLAVGMMEMIGDVMSSFSSLKRKKYVPLSILLNHKLKHAI